jgi:hypothetical protein
MKTIIYHELFPGAGKANATLRWLVGCTRRQPPSAHKSLVHITTRQEVEAGDVSRITASFGLRVAQTTLQRLRGRVHFTVAGYDEEPAEIYEIAAVREYYALVHAKWPCWSFAGDLHSPCLQAVALSLSPNVLVVRTADRLTVRASAGDIAALFIESIPLSAALNRYAGYSHAQASARLWAVARYLRTA